MRLSSFCPFGSLPHTTEVEWASNCVGAPPLSDPYPSLTHLWQSSWKLRVLPLNSGQDLIQNCAAQVCVFKDLKSNRDIDCAAVGSFLNKCLFQKYPRGYISKLEKIFLSVKAWTLIFVVTSLFAKSVTVSLFLQRPVFSALNKPIDKNTPSPARCLSTDCHQDQNSRCQREQGIHEVTSTSGTPAPYSHAVRWLTPCSVPALAPGNATGRGKSWCNGPETHGMISNPRLLAVLTVALAHREFSLLLGEVNSDAQVAPQPRRRRLHQGFKAGVGKFCSFLVFARNAELPLFTQKEGSRNYETRCMLHTGERKIFFFILLFKAT